MHFAAFGCLAQVPRSQRPTHVRLVQEQKLCGANFDASRRGILRLCFCRSGIGLLNIGDLRTVFGKVV